MQKAPDLQRLFRTSDTQETRDEIRRTVESGYRVSRLTDYQLKVREVNYYTNGTITIDPCIKYKNKGIDALLELLEEKYPRKQTMYIQTL